MQAWLCENPTGVEALQWKDLPTPEPKAGEVRIAIRAASTASAAARARAALGVISSGSPGPAPIRVTRGRMWFQPAWLQAACLSCLR